MQHDTRPGLLIKLSGEFFSPRYDAITRAGIIAQIKTLSGQRSIGLVIGGGNFFRGSVESARLGISATTGHTVGMLATVMNGLMLQSLLEQAGVVTELFSALTMPPVAKPLEQQLIKTGAKARKVLIFTGGLGNPFFTTDTTAIVRALQMDAREIWKATKVDGIYAQDPIQNPNAERFSKLSYKEVRDKALKVLDLTAITLAEEQKVKIRLFNAFEPDAFAKAARDEQFGSTIE